jgi:hypothetical protein
MIPPKLSSEIEKWIKDKKYGNIQINFSGGKIVNVNRTESFKVEVIWVDAPKPQESTISFSKGGISEAVAE